MKKFNTKEEAEEFYENFIKKKGIDPIHITRRGYIDE